MKINFGNIWALFWIVLAIAAQFFPVGDFLRSLLIGLAIGAMIARIIVEMRERRKLRSTMKPWQRYLAARYPSPSSTSIFGTVSRKVRSAVGAPRSWRILRRERTTKS
jgi:hypothetical protein